MDKKILAAALFFAFVLAMQGLASAYVSLSVTSQTVPSIIEPGEKANLILTITNSGSEYARNIKLKMKAHAFVSPDARTYDLQNIAPSSSTTVTIPITVSSGAAEGTTAMFFTLDYYEGSSTGTSTIENSISVTVTKRTLIEISNVSYSKDLIEPGKTVTMNIELKNVGRGRMKDLMVSIENADSPFVSAEGSLETYLGEFNPSAKKTASFNLIIKKDAKTIVYSIPVTISYYDESGTLHSDEKYIGMKINGKPEFVVNIDRLENAYAGNVGKITISIANRGTATAQFLTAKFDADFDLTPKENYVGNLDPDDSSTVAAEVNLRGKAPGKYKLALELLYKDPYNQEFSEKETLDFEIVQMPVQISATTQIIILAIVLAVAYWKRAALKRLIAVPKVLIKRK